MRYKATATISWEFDAGKSPLEDARVQLEDMLSDNVSSSMLQIDRLKKRKHNQKIFVSSHTPKNPPATREGFSFNNRNQTHSEPPQEPSQF